MVQDEYWNSPYYTNDWGITPVSDVYTRKQGIGKSRADANFREKTRDWYNRNFKSGRASTSPNDLSGMFGKGGTGTGAGLFSGINLGSPNFRYDLKGTGLKGWGKNLGKGFNWLNAGLQGYQAIQGLGDISETREDSKDLLADIVSASYNSPMLQYDLSSDQMDLLRDIRNDRYETDGFDLGDVDLLGVLADAGKGALMGLPGGFWGALIGGVGSAANSVIGDMSGSVEADNAELEALYNAILESEQQYKNIQKQKAYATLMG